MNIFGIGTSEFNMAGRKVREWLVMSQEFRRMWAEELAVIEEARQELAEARQALKEVQESIAQEAKEVEKTVAQEMQEVEREISADMAQTKAEVDSEIALISYLFIILLRRAGWML